MLPNKPNKKVVNYHSGDPPHDPQCTNGENFVLSRETARIIMTLGMKPAKVEITQITTIDFYQRETLVIFRFLTAAPYTFP